MRIKNLAGGGSSGTFDERLFERTCLPEPSLPNFVNHKQDATASRSSSDMNGGSSSSPNQTKLGKFEGMNLVVPAEKELTPPQTIIYSEKLIQLEWRGDVSKKMGVGLINAGNTCFLNATLQCLTYLTPLSNYLHSEDHQRTCRVDSDCFVCLLYSHIYDCQRSPRPFTPYWIIERLNLVSKDIVFGRQEDAHEFLRMLIDRMQENLLIGHQKLERYSRETTALNQIFGGYLRSQVVCDNCGARSNMYESFMDICLDIKDVQTINEAMQRFISPEVLEQENSFSCDSCAQKVRATKKFTIHRAPKALTVQLKRYTEESKVTTHIEFKERINLRPYMSVSSGPPVMYALSSVLVHSGYSTSAGHYYSYVRRPGSANGGEWVQMNDSTVTPVNLDVVLRAQAYLLFYSMVKPTAPFKIGLQGGSMSSAGPDVRINGQKPVCPSTSSVHGITAACSNGEVKRPTTAEPNVATATTAQSPAVQLKDGSTPLITKLVVEPIVTASNVLRAPVFEPVVTKSPTVKPVVSLTPTKEQSQEVFANGIRVTETPVDHQKVGGVSNGNTTERISSGKRRHASDDASPEKKKHRPDDDKKQDNTRHTGSGDGSSRHSSRHRDHSHGKSSHRSQTRESRDDSRQREDSYRSTNHRGGYRDGGYNKSDQRDGGYKSEHRNGYRSDRRDDYTPDYRNSFRSDHSYYYDKQRSYNNNSGYRGGWRQDSRPPNNQRYPNGGYQRDNGRRGGNSWRGYQRSDRGYDRR